MGYDSSSRRKAEVLISLQSWQSSDSTCFLMTRPVYYVRSRVYGY